MFEFLKKLGLKTETCSCGIKYWRLELDGYCGQCSKATIKNYAKNYVPTKEYEVELVLQQYLKYFETIHLHSTKLEASKAYKFLPYTRTVDKPNRVSRNSVNYMIAGISGYAPLYTRGHVYENVYHNGKPYAINRLVNAQTCIRFNDSENVGVTNRHATNFKMLGQHVFQTPSHKFTDEWRLPLFLELLEYLLQYFTDLSLYTIHESTWTDYIDEGDSLEIFINGLELCNQVYTARSYSDKSPLTIRYLDMGAGLARLTTLLNKTVLTSTAATTIKDHLTTAKLLYEAGIYTDKRGTGYAIRKLVQKAQKLDSAIYNQLLSELPRYISRDLDV